MMHSWIQPQKGKWLISIIRHFLTLHLLPNQHTWPFKAAFLRNTEVSVIFY